MGYTSGIIPTPNSWKPKLDSLIKSSGVLALLEKQVGQTTMEDIAGALDEYLRLFKAGFASAAEILTLSRAFPNNEEFSQAASRLENPPIVVGGPASVEMIDREGHLITTNALTKAFDKYMSNFRTRNAMVLHSDVQVGWALPAYISQGGQIFKSGVNEQGMFFITEVRDDTRIAKRVVEQINEGKLRSYSIAGSALKTQSMQKGLMPYMQVDELELAEVTVCEKGVNQGANFDILKGLSIPPTSTCIDGSCLISKDSLTQLNDVIGTQTGKLGKEQVQYRDATEVEKNAGIMCGTCKYFNAGMSTCDLVTGYILPSDWCSVFHPIDDSPVLENENNVREIMILNEDGQIDFTKSFNNWLSKSVKKAITDDQQTEGLTKFFKSLLVKSKVAKDDENPEISSRRQDLPPGSQRPPDKDDSWANMGELQTRTHSGGVQTNKPLLAKPIGDVWAKPDANKELKKLTYSVDMGDSGPGGASGLDLKFPGWRRMPEEYKDEIEKLTTSQNNLEELKKAVKKVDKEEEEAPPPKVQHPGTDDYEVDHNPAEWKYTTAPDKRTDSAHFRGGSGTGSWQQPEVGEQRSTEAPGSDYEEHDPQDAQAQRRQRYRQNSMEKLMKECTCESIMLQRMLKAIAGSNSATGNAAIPSTGTRNLSPKTTPSTISAGPFEKSKSIKKEGEEEGQKGQAPAPAGQPRSWKGTNPAGTRWSNNPEADKLKSTSKALELFMKSEAMHTIDNQGGREAEHHQLLREYGFPSEVPPEAARYIPVVETETTDWGCPIHVKPPWVVNEAGQELGITHVEDTPNLTKAFIAWVEKARIPTTADRKRSDIGTEGVPKTGGQMRPKTRINYRRPGF